MKFLTNLLTSQYKLPVLFIGGSLLFLFLLLLPKMGQVYELLGFDTVGSLRVKVNEEKNLNNGLIAENKGLKLKEETGLKISAIEDESRLGLMNEVQKKDKIFKDIQKKIKQPILKPGTNTPASDEEVLQVVLKNIQTSYCATTGADLTVCQGA